MSEKETYKEKMQNQLNEWKDELGKLKEKAARKAEQVGIEAQAGIKRQIDNLEEKIAQGKTKLGELAEATGEAWENLKDGAETLWASVKKAFQETSDKIMNVQDDEKEEKGE